MDMEIINYKFSVMAEAIYDYYANMFGHWFRNRMYVMTINGVDSPPIVHQ